ncbi:putative addiction module antidote protein [Sutterella faecalis]|uniref:Addiction module antidote protein n=2 Tax=Sutterella TaxID=40544 RepID=A0AAI9SAV1_9BURK|nr:MULTISPECIES: addiction module antidote protein [Sutterella]KAB7649461.1 putative addiction module antidote protein [Sutterella seckii]QDA55479.1 putative addiction module antidote protein [Sutterella faecalis]
MHFPVEQSPATLAAKPQKNEEDRIRLKMIQALNQALREANFDEVVRQSGDLARYHGMADIAARTGLNRVQLYRSLSDRGNPAFSTLMRVYHAMGLQITIMPKR